MVKVRVLSVKVGNTCVTNKHLLQLAERDTQFLGRSTLCHMVFGIYLDLDVDTKVFGCVEQCSVSFYIERVITGF